MGEGFAPARPSALRSVLALGSVFVVALAIGFWIGRTTARSPAETADGLKEQLIGAWLTEAGGTLEFKSDGTFEDSFRTQVQDIKPGEVIDDPMKLRMVERDAKRVGQYTWIDHETIEAKVAGQKERRSRIVIDGDTLSILVEDGTVERLKRRK